MKSTLGSLKSVFNVFRRKPSGAPERVALYKHHFRERFIFSVYFSRASLFYAIYDMKLNFSFILSYFV